MLINKELHKKTIELFNTKNEALKSIAQQIRAKTISNNVYLRAIIEISNICEKDCLYCGIRLSNKRKKHYFLNSDDILGLTKSAYDLGYRSIVIQSGEQTSNHFIEFIDKIIRKIKENFDIKIVLSCGEQQQQVYKQWKKSGADRYLLRIETSCPELYKKIHPNNSKHSFKSRIKCLMDLKKLNYQTGTGIMIGLPGQTLTDLAKDVEFFLNMDIDMLGMGPYIPNPQTPLYKDADINLEENYHNTLKMISICRILMPDINIASTTALEAIHSYGRIEGILYGANVLMPNITPEKFVQDYSLYENKPKSMGLQKTYLNELGKALKKLSYSLILKDPGAPLHYINKHTP